MGASALAAEAGAVCVPLALGAALGSTCARTQESCGSRVCHLGGSRGSKAGDCSAGCQVCVGVCGGGGAPTFTVVGTVHEAEVPEGVVGVFTENEAVIGVRALALPYVQAIGKDAGPVKDRSPAAAGAANKPRTLISLGALPATRRYVFSDFLFTLPGVGSCDDVVVAFGTRTVFRLPVIGASSVPLDFNVLGHVRLPLVEVLQVDAPVEVCVPIQVTGESLSQVVRLHMSFRALSTSTTIVEATSACVSYDDVSPCGGREEATASRGLRGKKADSARAGTAATLKSLNTSDVDRDMRVLEEQFHKLQGMFMERQKIRDRELLEANYGNAANPWECVEDRDGFPL